MDPRKVITVTLPGAPRTKKTSNRVVMLGKGDNRHPVVLPSEAFEGWLKTLLTFRAMIQRQIRDTGVQIPVEYPVQIFARVFRDRDAGDFTGYAQAIGDAIQDSSWHCEGCNKNVLDSRLPQHREVCKVAKLSARRKGLGLILDDAQIDNWDGTRLLIDRDNPRVELEIWPAEEAVTQAALNFAVPDPFAEVGI